MTHVPQVIVTLSPQGTLIAELPGPNGMRRQIELSGGNAEATLLRMLTAQQQSALQWEIGQDGAPTAAQVRHWEKHEQWADQSCRFCIAEGRIKGAEPAKRQRARIIVDNGGVQVRRIAPKVKGTAAAKPGPRAEDIGL